MWNIAIRHDSLEACPWQTFLANVANREAIVIRWGRPARFAVRHVISAVPGGWQDVDPTNNLVPSDRHILLAGGRDFDNVSPIKGVILGGGEHTVRVGVDVMPMPPSPL